MIKKFISYYKPHRLLFFADLLAAILMSSIDLIFPMLSRKIINEYIPEKNIQMMLNLAIVITVMFVLRALCNYFMNYWGHVMGARIERDMRTDLFNHFLILPFTFFDKNKTGKLMSRLVNDLHDISEMAHHVPEDLFISTLMILGSFTLLMTINVELALMLLAMVIFLIGFAVYKRTKMIKAFRRQREQTAVINAQIENTLSGIRLCKSYANESFEAFKFADANDGLYYSRKKAYKAMGEFSAGTHFFSDLMNLVIIIIGGMYTIYGKITMGDLVAYLLFTTFFMRPVKQVIQMIRELQSGLTGVERFYEIITKKSDIYTKQNAVKDVTLKGDIAFENVRFCYEDEKVILDAFNLKIPSGKHVALVGSSGVGKSTITHLIPRFYDVSSGIISIDGRNITEYDLIFLRKNIGIVQQDVFMFHGSIKENILYGKPDATDEEVIEASKKAFIYDFIISLPEGFDTFVGERGVKLSGGQKQRLSIARVFLKNPPIVILDEATSSLDNESEKYVQQALDTLAAGKTTITVAHRLTTVMNADEILVLKGSGVKERGTHLALMEEKGIYYKLFTAQFKGFIPDEI